MMSFVGSIVRIFVEQRAGKATLEGLSHNLEVSAVTIAQKLKSAPDTPANRTVANHVIGMERWGQRRLDTLFGQELLQDEYDAYQPGLQFSPVELSNEFQAARAETLARLLKISQNPGLELRSIRHNMLGPLSVKGWFFYLETHGSREISKIK